MGILKYLAIALIIMVSSMACTESEGDPDREILYQYSTLASLLDIIVEQAHVQVDLTPSISVDLPNDEAIYSFSSGSEGYY